MSSLIRVQPFARRPAHGVDDDFGAVRRGDRDPAREVLEPQRAARIQLDRPGDVLGFVGRRVEGRRGERKDSEGEDVLSHGGFDEPGHETFSPERPVP